jgi:predicted glycosyltransferase involved in capsule biosynthesis
MKISFCQVSGNRSDQLRLTLPVNLELINRNPDYELILVNYSSQDGFYEAVADVLGNFKLRTNQLKIINVLDKEYFCHSHGKNCAHKKANGDVLVNLDADNFLFNEFVSFISGLFSKNKNIITSGIGEGVYGRVCVSKDNFNKLGGYREDLDGMGYGEEDADLVRRAVKFLGCEHIFIPNNMMATLAHDDKKRTENIETNKFNIQNKKRMSESGIRKSIVNPNGDNWGIY